VRASVHIALSSAAVFHAVVVALCVLIIARLHSGRPWVRRLLTVSQLLSVMFSVVSWSSSTMFHAVIPPLDVLQLAAVALAWFPLASREFFIPAYRRPQPDRLDRTAT
jgi:hypothetical protein